MASRLSDPRKSAGKASLLDCCIHCADEPWCSAINFHRETQTCELNDIPSDDAIEENTFGWNVYYKVVDNKTCTNTTECEDIGGVCENDLCVCAAGMAFVAKEFKCVPVFGSSYYTLEDIHKNWTDAKKVCQAHGGHLLELETEEEFSFLKHILKDMYRGVAMRWWIGGHRMNQDTVFTWDSSGLRLKDTYEQWCEGLPKVELSYSNCLLLRRKCHYGYSHDECDSLAKFICEKELSND